MAKIWVNINLKNFNQSPIIIDFLIRIAQTTSKKFRMEDMIRYCPDVLRYESSGRIFRDLRFKGLIEYEIKDKSSGVYTLLSDIYELQRSKQRVIDKGYWIEETMPVMMNNNFAFPVEQMKLL